MSIYLDRDDLGDCRKRSCIASCRVAVVKKVTPVALSSNRMPLRGGPVSDVLDLKYL